MPYTYQHYPLALYRNGVYMAVADEAQEAAAKADGWTDYTSDRARMGIGDPVKAAEPVVETPPPTEAPAAPEPAAPTEPVKRKPGRPPKAKA